MDTATIIFLAVIGITIVLIAIFYWAMKKRKATLRFLAAIFGFVTLGLGALFGYVIQDILFFIIMVGITISQTIFILAIPKLAPTQFKALEERLGIRW